MESLKQDLLPAFIQTLIICFLKIFTLPWDIWTGAAARLAGLQREQDNLGNDDSEFPVLSWFKTALDGFLFIGYPIILLLMVLGFYQAGVSILTLYFFPIPYSMFKEMMTLGLSIALNLEKMAKKS